MTTHILHCIGFGIVVFLVVGTACAHFGGADNKGSYEWARVAAFFTATAVTLFLI